MTRVAIGAAVGGLVEVKLWTTAEEAANMDFDDHGEYSPATLDGYHYEETGLYRTEEDARAAVARAEATAARIAALSTARKQTAKERARDWERSSKAFRAGATLPADWRDRKVPDGE